MSCFDKIDTLTLYGCYNIVDITPFQNNRVIEIEQCFGIQSYCKAFKRSENDGETNDSVIKSCYDCNDIDDHF